MAEPVDLVLAPQELNLTTKRGDATLLRLRFWASVTYLDPNADVLEVDTDNSTLLSLSGYSAWRCELGRRGRGVENLVLDVDTSEQPSSVITVTLTAEQSRLADEVARWGLQATDPNGAPVTFYAGTWRIPNDEVPV